MRLWWDARSARERWLVGIMLLLAAILLVWLIVVRPLSDALDAVRMRHGAAAVALAEARARVAPASSGGRAAAGPVDAIAAGSAAAAGFPNARIAARGPGRASASLDAARPQALFGWIAQMEQAGLVVEQLRVQANADRTVSAEMVLGARR
ncbi:MAG: type II secretion system protein M [Sphingomonadaceae bacterium]|nr:type II secretion system protein M [Sphingomonadaceae bacterium]